MARPLTGEALEAQYFAVGADAQADSIIWRHHDVMLPPDRCREPLRLLGIGASIRHAYF
jgi:hypothetical protein